MPRGGRETRPPWRRKKRFKPPSPTSKGFDGRNQIKKHHPKWMVQKGRTHSLVKVSGYAYLFTNKSIRNSVPIAATLCFLVRFGGISPPRAVFLTRAMTVACQLVQLGLGVAGMMETCPSSAPDSIAVLLIKTQRPVFIVQVFPKDHPSKCDDSFGLT